jgi:hypothetical protein
VAHLTFQIRRRTKLRKRKRRKEKSFMCVCVMDSENDLERMGDECLLDLKVKRLKQIYCSWIVWFSG